MPVFLKLTCLSLLSIFVCIGCSESVNSSSDPSPIENKIMTQSLDQVESSVDAYQSYIDFFEEVYQKFEDEYYKPVSRQAFNRFIKLFDQKIYAELKTGGKSVDYIRWRSAAFLVDHLKSKEDIFSAFYPPKPAKEYEETALGKRIDLGITGEKSDEGYVVSHVEPRSDAYAKGLRARDQILKIDSKSVKKLTEEEVKDALIPLADSLTGLEYLSFEDGAKKQIDVLSKEYFKQTVFNVPVKVPGVFCFRLEKFNRKTSDDMFRFLQMAKKTNDLKGLILDLRNNPGGPPLAAREISAFFLKGGDDFAYFQKNNKPRAELDVPTIDDAFRYQGPLVILINKKSGSASELFSGILQKQGRAILMGTNSAGQVMLKSMLHFDDESMLLLITARGHHPDGSVFSFGGVVPNRRIEEDETDLVNYAATYLAYMNLQKKDN
ncbi:hypothetical protein MNBD_BACTEROID05-831 [hydrothermal vent metagenome]|uniref:PDZ domain-containing protein n=1 Tax=hydrothermal vent metagenome TaxID=652676 RepID=A0A3B0TJB2_9ZZZZ